ncbi:MAG: adenylate kinase [Candidatus Melainabacteria bacterium GWA2_34_9]|nr:MAG: adenylate kinase [Candidatus Melainabacteria bacterium GWA2_34_9]
MTTRVIFLGAPGCGKGTQASQLAKLLNIPHIDTGSMLREEIALQSEEGKLAESFMNQGQLAPATLVVRIIKNRLLRDDAQKGFILDGFPRSPEQAQMFEDIMSETGIVIQHVLNIEVDENILIDRMAFRKSCVCGEKYNTKFKAPKVEDVCDKCGAALTQRADDNVETAAKRIETYKKETEPLINYYTEKNLVRNVNGNQEIDKILADILSVLGVSAVK